MPNLAIHIIVPLLVLLIILKKEHQKYAWLLIPFAVFPDLDVLINMHRSITHNIFVPLIILSVSLAFVKYSKVFYIASFYWFSHVILDLFFGGVLLFYPLSINTYFVNALLDYKFPFTVTWDLTYGIVNNIGLPSLVGQHYPIIDSVGVISLGLVFIAFISNIVCENLLTLNLYSNNILCKVPIISMLLEMKTKIKK